MTTRRTPTPENTGGTIADDDYARAVDAAVERLSGLATERLTNVAGINQITAATDPDDPLTAYPVKVFIFRPAAANTAAVDLSIDGLGWKDLRDQYGNELVPYALDPQRDELVHFTGVEFRQVYTLPPFTIVVAPKNYVSGFTVSDNLSDPNNDVDIAAGIARDSSDTATLVGTAMTKQLDVPWAAGSNAGAALMSGNLPGTITITTNNSVVGSGTAFPSAFFVGDFLTTAGGQCRRITQIFSNTAMQVESNWSAGETNVTYRRGGKARRSVMRLFALYKSTDGSVDYGMSARDVPVDLPAGYTAYRLIRYKLTDGTGNNLKDNQQGNIVTLVAPLQSPSVTSNLNVSPGNTSSGSYTISTYAPPSVMASVRVVLRPNNVPATRYLYARQSAQTGGSPSDPNKGTVHLAVKESDGSIDGYPLFADVSLVLNGSAQFVADVLATAGSGGSTTDAIVSYVTGWIEPRT